MIYPKFLKPGDTIGICAPSKGIDPEDKTFDLALDYLKKDYKIVETENVRTGLCPASDVTTRAKDFNELMKNDDIDFIYCASGGDYVLEVLPYLDVDVINEKIAKGKTKYFCGYSDPTSILYYLTTRFDIATMYGTNAGSFGRKPLHESLQNALGMIRGEIPIQKSFPKYERITIEELIANAGNNFILNTDDIWITPNGSVDIEGRLIGGCIDCLKYLIGTRFDFTKEFIEKYKDDGIVWYFDNFALNSNDLYYTLWQMREAGWFKYAKGFVFGRVIMPKEVEDLSYEKAIKRALGNEIPIIMEADIGHVKPVFNLINGSIGHFKSQDGKGSLEMKLK